MDKTAAKAFAFYGLGVRRIGSPQKGYRNTSYKAELTDGRLVNLVIYKAEEGIAERIKRLNVVGNIADQTGLPTRHLVDTRILQLSHSNGTRYAALYNYLPGSTIPWEGYTKHHIKLLGATMGKLHASLSSHQPHNMLHAAREQAVINDQMEQYFTQTGVQKAMGNKLQLQPSQQYLFEDFKILLAACDKLPNQQPLHMDLVRGNILFDAASAKYDLQDGPIAVSGIIDFEKTSFGHPVFDLARTYAFLLVDCKYKMPDKIHKYFFVSGYQKRGGRPLPVIRYKNKDTLHELTNFFLLHDFYKFLRHNPYEFLGQNEHYLKTRDILVARGLLKTL